MTQDNRGVEDTRDGKFPKVLQKGATNILDSGKCRRRYPQQFDIPNKRIRSLCSKHWNWQAEYYRVKQKCLS